MNGNKAELAAGRAGPVKRENADDSRGRDSPRNAKPAVKKRKKKTGKNIRQKAVERSGKIRKDLQSILQERLASVDMHKALIAGIPYVIIFYLVEKEAWLYRHCTGDSMIQKLMNLFLYFSLAFKNPIPSFHLWDVLVGIIGSGTIYVVVQYRRKNAKKYRQGVEYGSARWGTPKDIAPYIDPVPDNNIILTATESLTMNSRPKNWKYARNKNVIVIGGSGSGKTRYYVKPQLMQLTDHVSYVVTDPKGTIVVECGKMLVNHGYTLKILNTINFSKSFHYNPFHYIRSEKEILKLVNGDFMLLFYCDRRKRLYLPETVTHLYSGIF